MGKMRVYVADPGARQEALDKITGLKEVLECGQAACSAKAAYGGPERFPINPRDFQSQQQVVIDKPGQRHQKRFRKIIDPGPDLLDISMGEIFPGGPHGKNVNRDALAFQEQNFV